MRKSSRLAMLGLSVLATSAMVAGTAAAEAPTAYADKFAARAEAQAMTISLFGTQITGSNAVADLDASPVGKATVSELILGGPLAKEHTAEVSGLADVAQVSKPDACPLDELEAIPGVARVDIVCPEASAAIAGQLPSARALGAEVVLEPSVSAVLDTLGLQEPVVDGANQVFEQVLNPLVEALTGTPIESVASDTVTTVQDVLNDTLTLNSTARIVVAPALAQVTSDVEKIHSLAHAQGVRIELLPVNELGATNGLLPDDLVAGEPLITITIGEAKAECTYFRSGTALGGTDGKKECPDPVPAAVCIDFGSTALTDALGLAAEPMCVAPGVEQCILVDSPLETCVAAAAAGVDADGNPYATATSVALFKGVNGGINLATAAVTSGSAGQAAPPAAALPAGDLPRTGGSDALPIMGAGLLAVAVLGRRIAIGRA